MSREAFGAPSRRSVSATQMIGITQASLDVFGFNAPGMDGYALEKSHGLYQFIWYFLLDLLIHFTPLHHPLS
jgi:hypothetical protein